MAGDAEEGSMTLGSTRRLYFERAVHTRIYRRPRLGVGMTMKEVQEDEVCFPITLLSSLTEKHRPRKTSSLIKILAKRAEPYYHRSQNFPNLSLNRYFIVITTYMANK